VQRTRPRGAELRLTLSAALATAALLLGRALAATVMRPSPDMLREHLHSILSSRAYQVNPPIGYQIQRWLLEALARVLDWLSRLTTSGPLAGLPEYLLWVIRGVLLLALLLILYHLAITLRLLLAGPSRRAEQQAWLTPRRSSPEQALRAAREAAARGEFRLALRRLYEAVLLRLDHRGILVYAPWRTNWENLRALKSPRLRTTMEPLTRAVDDVFYGDRPATDEIYADCQQRVSQLWHAEAGHSE
jgi:hypothetical protein